MKIIWFNLFIYQIKNLKTMYLLLITDINKSHYVYIKDFNRFICNKTKFRTKNVFVIFFALVE